MLDLISTVIPPTLYHVWIHFLWFWYIPLFLYLSLSSSLKNDWLRCRLFSPQFLREEDEEGTDARRTMDALFPLKQVLKWDARLSEFAYLLRLNIAHRRHQRLCELVHKIPLAVGASSRNPKSTFWIVMVQYSATTWRFRWVSSPLGQMMRNHATYETFLPALYFPTFPWEDIPNHSERACQLKMTIMSSFVCPSSDWMSKICNRGENERESVNY